MYIFIYILYVYIYIYIYIYYTYIYGIVATHALGHMMYDYTLLVPMNQRVLNKLSKERNISGYK